MRHEIFGKGIVRLDGAMGTQLQARGLKPGEIPETWNVTHPADVKAVHAAYVASGSDIVYANTFGASPLKYRGDAPLRDVITAGVALARAAAGGRARVALDVGPLGRLLKPAGDLPFDAACEAFAEQIRIGAAAGADLIALETFTDAYELKAAILAAREQTALPVLATVALGGDGRLLTGADVDCLAALFNALKPDAVGFNCGLGPERMHPYVERLAQLTDIPIAVKPNAGMPRTVGGETVFDVTPEAFAAEMRRCVAAGATVVGGCCGTTPAHLAALSAALAGVTPAPRRAACARAAVVSSGSRTVTLPLDDVRLVGERINPTGKKRLREAYAAGDMGYVMREAIAQADAGAHILDVNAGVPGLDEPTLLRQTVEAVQSVTDVPLQIDTADPAALEAALRHYNGKALVNSVNGREASMAAVFPLVAKYGGTVVALALDETGIPPTPEGRVAIARRILERGAAYGLGPEDFVFDALCLAVSAEPLAARVVLETIRRLHGELGLRTILGVSNVSFGLPQRPLVNATFLTQALEAGLTTAIVNPLCAETAAAWRAWRALTGRDTACGAWIASAAAPSADMPSAVPARTDAEGADEASLRHAIERGLKGDAAACSEALLRQGAAPVSVVENAIAPALEAVGRGFEAGRVYLPQLLMAAEAAGAAFEGVRRTLAASGAKTGEKGTVVLATVQGDIHDIGKNIVRALLENYGFRVIDLGRDVPPETVVATAVRERCRLVGLSALMTTTLGAMKETVAQLKAADPAIATIVGGAVLTAACAREIGATWYAKDAMATVRLAEAFYADRP